VELEILVVQLAVPLPGAAEVTTSGGQEVRVTVLTPEAVTTGTVAEAVTAAELEATPPLMEKR
jgi:hypothetical protein